MQIRLSVVDYNAEWALKERNQIPRSKPGYLTCEEVVSFYGTLGVYGIELMHYYWSDYTPAQLRQLVADAGLSIACFVFLSDLALPSTDRGTNVDEACRLLDRTAELGTSLAMIVPAIVKPDLPLELQRAWMIEGLRQCAERAQSLSITLLAENIDYAPVRPLMGRGSDCVAICREVDSTAFRLIFDAGCPLLVDEDPIVTLREMAPYLAHMHVKNGRPLESWEKVERYNELPDGRRFIGTALDRGLVDLPSVIEELERLNYHGGLNIEYQGEDDPRIIVPHNVEYLRQIAGSSIVK